jgi:hypothetical protein
MTPTTSPWRKTVADLREVGRNLARHPIPREYEGATPTVRRLLNYYLLCWEWYRVKTTLRSYPVRLIIESSGACNLSCPHCFTGAGEVGHARSPVALEFYRRLLAEMGDYLWQVELHNWGEPLLNKHVGRMIAEASARGISTSLCTNFSLPFDRERAEQLVTSGLKVLGVSIDGARQETYEQYRVGGQLDVVLRNCRLVADAKARLGSPTPRMNWVFIAFPHNLGDIDTARAMAHELGMDFKASRGRVFGPDWDPEARLFPHEEVEPIPCYTLWHTVVVNSDGGVAPCCGSFYKEDDMGRLMTDAEAPAFREVWNGERFRLARQFYNRRTGTDAERQHICFNCPQTIDWEHFVRYVVTGGSRAEWEPTIKSNERYNYFLTRRPPGAVSRPRARAAAARG